MWREFDILGWDLGGAHLKMVLVDGEGRPRRVEQLAVPLWEGLDRLDTVWAQLSQRLPFDQCKHALTMTGELVDLFDSRAAGVRLLAQHSSAALGEDRLRLFAGPKGFVRSGDAEANHADIASANWFATGAWLATRMSEGLLIDVGSTTCDILPFADGRVRHVGYSDRERLASEELIYTGVVRTPVMAVAQRLPIDGGWVGVANECFATMADVYRVLGWLPDDADLHPAADGCDKRVQDSMRRLARMLGADLADASPAAWRRVAAYVADRQIDSLAIACHRQLSRGVAPTGPLVGAGSGRFLVRRLAGRLGRSYVDIDDCLPVSPAGQRSAGDCAPAAAVALLARAGAYPCAC